MSRTMIDDEIAKIPGLSRQQRWQLRKKRDKRCIICGSKNDGQTVFCKRCRKNKQKRNGKPHLAKSK